MSLPERQFVVFLISYIFTLYFDGGERLNKSMMLIIDTPETCGRCRFCVDNYGCNYLCTMTGKPDKEGYFTYADVSDFLTSKYPKCPFIDGYEFSELNKQNDMIKIPRMVKFTKELFIDFDQIIDLQDIAICRINNDGYLSGNSLQYMVIPQKEDKQYKITPIDPEYHGEYIIKYISPYRNHIYKG